MDPVEEILQFWFGDPQGNPAQNSEKWFRKDTAFDEEVRKKFEPLLLEALQGRLGDWKLKPRSYLAYIILLDQFSRNMYRDTPKAFAQDSLALQASLEGQEKGFDEKLSPVERQFFYMPMMHSEDLDIQRRSVEAFQKLSKEGHHYAVLHMEIIQRFGRFPHRNAILGRPSTEEEVEFLKQPGSSF